MDEQTLPGVLRDAAAELERHGADDLAFRDGAVLTMRAAADELERLQGELAGVVSERDIAERGRDYLAERLATAVLDGPQALEALEGSVAAELAGDAGVPAPMPVPRRFTVWLAVDWDRPSPGSFVFAGPALAVWRVLDVEAVPREAAQPITTHDSEDGKRWPVHVLLEAVDSHDVPTTARVTELPLPVVEVHDADPAGAGS